MSSVSPYKQAIAAVSEWLDGDGVAYARRVTDGSAIRQLPTWEIDVPNTPLAGKPVRLVLPKDFPASCLRIYTDKALCLKLPHVEEDGRLCLGEPSPADYENPCEAVGRVLRAFELYLSKVTKPEWVSDELHKERLSYWLRFCQKKREARDARPIPRLNVVCLDEMVGYSEGEIAVYSNKGPNKRPQTMVACMGEQDPQALAQRHNWVSGTLTKGNALFVQMPQTQLWTPTTWPETLLQLDALIGSLTEGSVSVLDWIRGKLDGGSKSFLVVLIQDGVAYGYLIHPADVWRVELPKIQPLHLTRIDANWSLGRDHGLDVLSLRRRKRVLVLGCGSLGSPVVELLARAGVGHLEILDKDTFESENCSRHMLGLSALRRGKVGKLADRLRAELPGIEIKPHVANATTWIAEVCEPGKFDMVVDCTAESAVRIVLAQYRNITLGACPLIHAWLEPFCAAAHVVSIHAPDSWPMNDPADGKINAAEWADSTRINLPACSAGFHPYGAADVWQAAGFTAERVLAELDGQVTSSTVWSWVRSRAYFDGLNVQVSTRAIVPPGQSRLDAAMITRDFRETVGGDE